MKFIFEFNRFFPVSSPEVDSKENTPLANLWTTMLQDAGTVDRFADANATASSILS